jgi:hypothetical protein
MEKIIFITIFIFIAITGCNKLDIAKGTPKCIEKKIRDFDKTSCDNGANVKEYTFQNKTVYVFNPGTCGADMTSEVTDSDCNSMGFLGGIAGNTIINGEDFSNASFVKIIWKK